MTTPLQSYNNLLTMCSTLWDQVKVSNLPPPLDVNIPRAIKTIVELGSNVAINTLIANMTTTQLKECKTFMEVQVDFIYKATLCFAAGTILLGIGRWYQNKITDSRETTTQKVISKSLTVTPFLLFAYGTYRTANFYISATYFLNNIEKLPILMNENIKQVEALRNAFFVDGLYKTF